MKLSQVRWGMALGGAVAAELVLVAGAFAWVAIYSHLLHPGEALAFYEQYALMAAPWVSVILGIPVFYLACRWIGSRSPSAAWPTAMAFFGAYLLIDVSFLVFGENTTVAPWFLVANYLLKFLACHLGGRSAARRTVARPA